jgi:transposase
MPSPTLAPALPFSTVPADGLAADKRRAARHLYWQGWRISSIAEYIGEPRSTVQGWKDAEDWDKAQPAQRVEAALERFTLERVAEELERTVDELLVPTTRRVYVPVLLRLT